jgi:hypothetical protein
MNKTRVSTLLVALALASASVAPSALDAQQATPVLGISDARTRDAVSREIERAASRGLPVRALVAKAQEGVTKQAPADRIRTAVTSLARRLETARDLLAPSPSDAEMIAGADALAVGVPAPMLRQIRAAYPAGQSVAMPLDVLTELVARGVPASNALTQITQLMRRGATPTHIAGLGASVQSDVAAGLTPDAALEVRARGVMSLLPSPAAVSATSSPRGTPP